MSQTQPFWNIYQNVHNNYRPKYQSLPKQLRILISIFTHELAHEDEPQLYPDVFSCESEDAYGFRIGNKKILFETEVQAQGFDDVRVLHMIDII